LISKDEILSVADETGLTPSVVEKDYVLGWLLAAIHQNAALSDGWVFKGGTCLKKCYFETYRFSEDLDFTLKDESHLDEEFLTEQFSEIAEWLYEACGIELPQDRFKFDIYENPRGKKSCQGRIYYGSYFASGKKSMPKIKLDLTVDEVLVMPPSRQPVIHSYSDVPGDGIHVNCYSYPEVFGEKVRALGERGRPRDLYDVINLYRNDQLPAPAIINDVLAQKCAYKEIEKPKLAGMDGYRNALIQNWEPMLAHQLPALPAFGLYWDALPEFFEWLESPETERRAVLGAVSREGTIYRPAYGQLNLRALSGRSLEIIRFAAGNRLCVNLDYTDNNGNRRTRVIEPYSLRQAQNGNILLYAVRADNGQIRAYKINQINDASVVNQTFIPRYQIELSPSLNIPPTQYSGGALPSLDIPKSSPARPRARTARKSSFSNSGPTYIYRCPMCSKTFRRKKQDSRLNPHKTKDGFPCSGRIGYFEETKY